MTSTNYTGRTVDLLIFQGTAPEGDTPITLTFNGVSGGYVVTGIQKLSQTFATMFLTRKGTAIDPEYGTNFVTRMQQGRLQTETDVRTAFGGAAEAIKRKLAAVDGALSDDERLDTAELTGLTIDRGAGKITLTVLLTSLAGSSRTVFLPVTAAIK